METLLEEEDLILGVSLWFSRFAPLFLLTKPLVDFGPQRVVENVQLRAPGRQVATWMLNLSLVSIAIVDVYPVGSLSSNSVSRPVG